MNNASDSISITATGADDDGTVSNVDICYAVGGQDSTYYQGGSSVFTCETTTNAQGSFSITHPYEYYTTNVANPNGLEVGSIVFSTNIYDVPDGAQFCSSNPGFNSNCAGKMV